MPGGPEKYSPQDVFDTLLLVFHERINEASKQTDQGNMLLELDAISSELDEAIDSAKKDLLIVDSGMVTDIREKIEKTRKKKVETKKDSLEKIDFALNEWLANEPTICQHFSSAAMQIADETKTISSLLDLAEAQRDLNDKFQTLSDFLQDTQNTDILKYKNPATARTLLFTYYRQLKERAQQQIDSKKITLEDDDKRKREAQLEIDRKASIDSFLSRNAKIKSAVDVLAVAVSTYTDGAEVVRTVEVVHHALTEIGTLDLKNEDEGVREYVNGVKDKLSYASDALIARFINIEKDRLQSADPAKVYPEVVDLRDQTAAVAAKRDLILTDADLQTLEEAKDKLVKLRLTRIQLSDGTAIPIPEQQSKIFDEDKEIHFRDPDFQIKRLKEILDDRKLESRARVRVERLWAEIAASEHTIKGTPENTKKVDSPYIEDQRNIDEAGILPLVERFFPVERARWVLMLEIMNGFNAAARTDVFKEFSWNDVAAGRTESQKHINTTMLLDFRRMVDREPATRNIFDRIESYFANPQEYVVRRVGDKFEAVGRGRPGPGEISITHDYAKDGNPTEEEASKGHLSIGQLLKMDYPNACDSVLGAVQYVGIIGELRLKYHHRYHGSYLKSPDSRFDTKPIFAHSPLEAILYQIRSKGKVYPEHRLLWQILRLPRKSGPYVENLTQNSSRDARIYSGDATAAAPEFSPVENKARSSPDEAYGNENVEGAIEYRTFMDMGLTSYSREFHPVRMTEEMTVVPYMWDFLFDSQYNRGPSMANFSDAVAKWESFIALAQNPRVIKHLEDVNDSIGSLLEAIAPFKAILVVTKDTDVGNLFRDLINQMLLRNLKNVYDQYMVGAKFSTLSAITRTIMSPRVERKGHHYHGRHRWRLANKRDRFFEVVIEEIEKKNTLPDEFREFLLEKLEHAAEFQFNIFGGLFSTTKGDPLRGVTPRESERRGAIIEQYSREPTQKERENK